jgi:methionine-rich copper-binding protein CopC
MSRVFFSDEVTFTHLGVPNVQVNSSLLAYVYLNGSPTAFTVLVIGPGQITENEFDPGQYRYLISNYEVPNTTTSVEVQWFGFVGSDATDTHPLITNPTPVTQPVGVFLSVLSTQPSQNQDMGVRDRITIEFSEALDPSFIHQNKIFIQRVGSTSTAGVSASLDSSDPTRLVVSPNSKLTDNSNYQMLFQFDAVRAVSGVQLENDFLLSFKTTEDDFKTLFQATDDGVVERAGPLRIATPPSQVSSPAATLTSSTPEAKTCNHTTKEIVLTFDEDIDIYNSQPVLELNFTPVFSTSKYHINQQFWGKDTEPDHPTDILFGGGLQARGSVVFNDNPSDGDTLEVSDGVNTVVFEFDSDASVVGGNVAVDIGATVSDTLANYIEANNTSVLNITAVDNSVDGQDVVLLVHQDRTQDGNVPIVAVSAVLDVEGMDGGADSDGSTPTTLHIIDNKVFITLNKTPTGNAFLNLKLSGLFYTSDHTTELEPVEIEYITGLWPMRGTVNEIIRSVRRYIPEDLTNCDLAVLLTEVSIHYFRIYKNEAIPHQHCAVQSEVILILLDEFMAISSMDGSKSLGPFSVSGPKSQGFLRGPYKRWLDELEECLRTLNAFFNRPVTGIKSSNNPLERPTTKWRIRTWNNTNRNRPSGDENLSPDRRNKIPNKGKLWS